MGLGVLTSAPLGTSKHMFSWSSEGPKLEGKASMAVVSAGKLEECLVEK